MKLYPSGTVCPHCGTVYRYADTKRLVRKKTTQCYHCQKTCRVSRSSVWVLAAELLAVYAILNAVAIGLLNTSGFVPLFLMNIIPAVAAVYLIPLYIELKKAEKAR